MAVPLQYQSQYVPTDFGVTGNILGMLRQDMQQRNVEYEQGVASEQFALSKLAELETTDQATKQQMMQDLESRIGEAVKGKGMDYGAAAGDIGRIISKEKAKPWYQFDAAKLAKMQEYGKLQKQMGLNFYATGDPSKGTLEDYIADPTSLEFDVFNKEQLRSKMAGIGKNAASLYTENINRQVAEGVREIGIAKGYRTPELQAKYMEEEGQQAITDLMIGYGLDPNNQEIRGELEQELLASIKGEKKTQFIYPRVIESPNKLPDDSAIGSLYMPIPEVEPRIYKKAEKTKEDITSIINTEGGIEEPKETTRKQAIQIGGQFTGPFGATFQDVKDTNQKAYDKFQDYKDKYSALYTNMQEKKLTDADFLNQVTDIEKNKAYILDSRIGFNDPKFTEYVIENFDFKKSQFFKIKDGKKTNKDISLSEYTKKFKDSGLTYKDSKIFISPKGQIIVQDPDGDEYEVNKESFNITARNYLDKIGNVFDNFYDYSLNKKEVDEINSGVYSLGAGVQVAVRIPKNDVMNKKLGISFPDPTTGETIIKWANTPDEFYGYMSQLINADVFKGK